ncbi:MAG: hypothetical protein U0Q20_01085 [Mycobacterium sp.]|nr:hypothetical protein [Mycobacterium sp.]HNP14709.1 hypothetical protein [Mycobacterium sp.]
MSGTLAAIERGVLVFKKLFFTAAAAAAVSVPLAATGWAEPPSSPSSTDTSTVNGVGKGGMPQKLGDFSATGVTPPLAASNDPIPPGKEFNLAKDLFKGPGESTPDAIRDFESFVWSNSQLVVPGGTETITSNPQDWEGVTPGLAIKPLTPGCDHGRSAVPSSASTRCVG